MLYNYVLSNNQRQLGVQEWMLREENLPYMCVSSGPNPLCEGREASAGYCQPGGSCPSGFICTPSNVCCRCAYGTSIGLCCLL
ncbi:hypothetical protein ANCDUO_12546 [Ancylostoma duodenale]|uniref:Uncharacterized protein n=1 Tax=Ancylostoma duodenale TaxID=51022 RepID=A0A0C2G8F3_9BILA|nr:hypothetical protein ANCDUO_12546 [Ancylostoma duodenale]